MNSLSKLFFFCSFLLLGGILFNGCVEEEFDQPPTDGVDPGLTATTTIQELKDMHTLGNIETIDEDLIIKGVVIADDASGNLYRTFFLQDETAGIMVNVNLSDSYVVYPVGRELYIKLKGLILSDYNNLIQINGYIFQENGGQSVGPIIDLTGHIIKGVKKGLPEPTVKKITELTLNDVGSLIKLEDVQFLQDDLNQTYADAVNRETLNRTLEDCDHNPILVRTSGFANFAADSLAKGGGSFVGVLSVYRDDFQFLIRDLRDVQLSGDRCDPCKDFVVVKQNSVDEGFSGGSNNQAIELSGWVNGAAKGSRTWIYKYFSGENNTYAQATAYTTTAPVPEMEAWLVTPAIINDVDKVLTFRSAYAYWTHNALSVWVSSDFVCDPTNATWKPLSAALPSSSSSNFQWVESGTVDLSDVTGDTFVIGFKHVGSSTAGQTGNSIVDNVVVKNK